MKTAIITGASRGIGKAAALRLAGEYDYIAICCHTKEEMLSEVGKALENTCGGRDFICRTFTGDVSDYNFVSEMVDTVLQETNSIHTLINNAGISSIGLFTDTTPDEWDQMIRTNLTSVYNTCRRVVPEMIKRKEGKILNISSVWGLSGASCEVAYSSAKGAVNSFTKALAKELAPSNIAVNAIAFGAIDTDMNSHLSEEEKTALKEEIPYGRMGTPEEAAECIANILAMPNYFTGEIVKFDGGWI